MVAGWPTERPQRPFGAGHDKARIESELAARGVTVFANIDHAAGAAEAGMTLRPTTLIIFGNAKAGTPLMQACQRAGIDLPLKGCWFGRTGTARLG